MTFSDDINLYGGRGERRVNFGKRLAPFELLPVAAPSCWFWRTTIVRLKLIYQQDRFPINIIIHSIDHCLHTLYNLIVSLSNC